MHPQCESVRMVDRCSQCNPGYGDPNQAHEIYTATKNGTPLRAAEDSYTQRRKSR